MKEFKINKYITLKLEDYISDEGIIGSFINLITRDILKISNKTTTIYVNGERFDQCKFLLLDVPTQNHKLNDDLSSIDEAAEKLDHSLEVNIFSFKLTPEIEFWAHCSNIQAWAESNYDTRLLHRNLAFPLLKRLTEAGDPIAKRVFKEEIAKRFASGHNSVIMYLLEEGYLEYLNDNEIEGILEELDRKDIDYVIYNNEKIFIIYNQSLDLSYSGITDITRIRNLVTLKDLKKLNLSHNRIKDIKSIESLKNLEFLDLSFNQIDELRGLDGFTNLKELYLQGNRITEIKGLENLANLRKINLWLNPIKLSQFYLLFFNPKKIVQFCRERVNLKT